MDVIKRDGRKVSFDKNKIVVAITKANDAVHIKNRINKRDIQKIANDIEAQASSRKRAFSIEEIQELVENGLIEINAYSVAKAYIKYRYNRELVRKANTTDESIRDLINGDSDYWNYENSNKNAKLVTTQRDYMAGITSTDIARRFIFPKEAVEAHDKGIIHIHDMDYAAENTRHNCCLINLNDMLQNGTVLNGIMIEKPHRILTASTIATQIILGVSSSQYGGATVTLTHLAPFVRDSYERFIKKYRDYGLPEEDVKRLADIDLRREVKDAVQTFNYQVNSMSSQNGQSPFLSVCMYMGETEEYKPELAMLIEEFLLQRIEGMKNEKGVRITTAFPKLLFILDEHSVDPNDKYYYLTRLAAECSSKRLTPDYISAKVMKENKINQFGTGDAYPCMGCRSFLQPDKIKENYAKAKDYIPGQGKYYGRFNCGVVTLNLPYVAMLAKTTNPEDPYREFWKQLDKYANILRSAQETRIHRLENTVSDVAPILWQYGALARLDKGETLYNLVHNDYASISFGMSGLYECVKAMTGEDQFTGKGKEFGLAVMNKINDYCKQWKAEDNVGWSVYGSPMESTTGKFAHALKRDFGNDVFVKIDGHDRDFITNSVHWPVWEPIDAFSKLSKEAEFQNLTPGGCIVYCESVDLSNNIDALIVVINHIYENVQYAEINITTSYCKTCGATNMVELVEEDGRFKYKCKCCGETNPDNMNVAFRVCGYISTNIPNQSRLNDVYDRVKHIDNVEYSCCR